MLWKKPYQDIARKIHIHILKIAITFIIKA